LGELSGDISEEANRAYLGEAAFEVDPNFTSHVGPALAEAEVFAKIEPGFLVNDVCTGYLRDWTSTSNRVSFARGRVSGWPLAR
jgi:hypothetical protein